MIRNKIAEGEVIDVVDLLEPRRCLITTYDEHDALVGDFVSEGVSPESCAHHALHADRVVRVQVFDGEGSGELLIERSDPS